MADATDPPPATRPLRIWIALALLAVAALVYTILVPPHDEPRGTQGPAIGRRLQYLRLEGLTGGAQDVAITDLEGRVTLLNYWGTWCPPCLREFPDVVELDQRFAGRKDFRLYAVSCGERDDPALDDLRKTTEAFLASRLVDLPTYADRNAASRRAMMLVLGLSQVAYPTTLVFDRQGVIRGFWQGYHPRAAAEMGDLVEQLLTEEAAGQPATSSPTSPAAALPPQPDSPRP
jgi:thiol-disulfide isomerase/thioredoxin